MPQKIVIVDYRMGNLHSVMKKMKQLNADAIVSGNEAVIRSADKLILPGVGHFARAMQFLGELHLIDVLNEFVLVQRKPILGICLGMQLMARSSEEGNAPGFGWVDAEVVRFRVKDTLKYKVPHTGWNQIVKKKESVLMRDIPDLSEFYFVHSYHFVMNDKSNILNETVYEYPFASALEVDNIFGVQYHPEKSHKMGDVLLKNFLSI